MNFSSLFFIFFILTACGVKGPPKEPQETKLPTWEEKYLNEAFSEKKKKSRPGQTK